MPLLNTLQADACRALIGFAVADRSRQPVGTLSSIWANEGTGRVQFLGVRTVGTGGRGHLVPAEGVQVDAKHRFVRLPYPGLLVHDGPADAAAAALSLEREREIYLHYDVLTTRRPHPSSLRHEG